MKAILLTKFKMAATVVVVGFAVLASSAAGWQANAAGSSEPQTVRESARKAPRDPDKERIAQLEEERELLLRQIRELRDRLEKIEYAQNLCLAQERRDMERADTETRLRLQDGRAKEPAWLNARRDSLPRLPTTSPTPAMKPVPVTSPADNRGGTLDELKARIKRLEEERAKPAPLAPVPFRGGPDDEMKDLEAKLKKLQDERAKAAGGSKSANADRVAELETRVRQIEANVLKLLAEVERLRKK